MTTCDIIACDRAVYAKCLCAKHYQEAIARKLGVKKGSWIGVTVTERLANKSIAGENGCILFVGAKQKFGHGKFMVTYPEGKITSAHRASYRNTYGPIPEGLCVLHKCDVPNCINPEHLFLGTLADNVADMRKKRRQATTPRETLNPNGKLTDAQVLEIRLSKDCAKEVAIAYGVSASHVYNIRNGYKRICI